MKCCTGKILEVNLSDGTTKARAVPDEVYEKVLGGKGLAAWYLLKHIPANADPLGPDNILGFMTGALTGTGAFMCGRWLVCGKSPLTGGWGDASCGGMFAAAIKQCGYDGIFVRGIADKPVYLYADNTKVEIRDASKYWGKGANESEKLLTEDNWNRKKPSVACIGQGGENLSLISGVCNEDGRIAARSGLGAVMGAKRLKAVVLCGSKPMPCADREAVNALSRELGTTLKAAHLPSMVKGSMLAFGGTMMGKMSSKSAMDGMMSASILKRWGTTTSPMAMNSGDSPVKNWGGSIKDFPGITKGYNPDIIAKRKKQSYHCYACALGCGAVLDVQDFSERENSHRPEYESINAFGPLVGNRDTDTMLAINDMLNDAGMDTISAGTTVSWAIEAYEKGMLTSDMTDGLELSWGNSEAILELVMKMISRQGIGDDLADGVKRASERYGGKDFAIHVGGQEPAEHDSRNDPQMAIEYVTEAAPGKHTSGGSMQYGMICLWDYVSWAPPLNKIKKTDDLVPREELSMRAVANGSYAMLSDALGGCHYGQLFGLHSWNPFLYLNAANGVDHDGDYYMEIGKRIQTLRQLFNVKQGFDPAAVHLPDRMAGKPPLKEGPLKGITLQNDEGVRLAWKGYGWNPDTGVPTDECIKALGIDILIALEEE